MLNTEKKIGRWKLLVIPAYLLLRINQWKKKGKQKKWQEQTILANAVCAIHKAKVLNQTTLQWPVTPTDNSKWCLTLSSLWYCPGLAHENLGNTSTSSCCSDSHSKAVPTLRPASFTTQLHTTVNSKYQWLQHTAEFQVLHLVLIHITSNPNTSPTQELLVANNINCDGWIFLSRNSLAESQTIIFTNN